MFYEHKLANLIKKICTKEEKLYKSVVRRCNAQYRIFIIPSVRTLLDIKRTVYSNILK
jgi:hypothetical protein